MAQTYANTDRTGITLTNVSNAAIEVYDNRTSYRFGPGESKTMEADKALRLNSQNGNLKLPDQGSDATGNLFGKEIPGSGVLSAQKV